MLAHLKRLNAARRKKPAAKALAKVKAKKVAKASKPKKTAKTQLKKLAPVIPMEKPPLPLTPVEGASDHAGVNSPVVTTQVIAPGVTITTTTPAKTVPTPAPGQLPLGGEELL